MKDVPAGFVRIETPTAHAVLNVEDWRLPQGGRLQARLTHLEVGLKDGVRSLRAMRQCKGPKKKRSSTPYESVGRQNDPGRDDSFAVAD